MDGLLLGNREVLLSHRKKISDPLQKFAWAHYKFKPTTIKTFKSDFSRFRLLNLKLNNSTLDLKACINNIIILFNTFESNACLQLLFTIITENNFSKLKTLLLFINRLPPVIPGTGINTLEIPLDQSINSELREMA